MAHSIFGITTPEPPTGGGGLVRLGRFADRRNRGSGTVRKVGKIRNRAYGASTPGRVSRVGRQSNRSN